MKLRIENWIADNNFSEDVDVLFKDAVTCYKAGANRASLLFSYLAFLTVLKERIVSGVKPVLFDQWVWDEILNKLQNEDIWEATVFDAIQRKEVIEQSTKVRTKDPIFNISDNLKFQIRYWKDRRNDCAHYRDNIIDASHVGAFWAFIESNLSKITIEGGMQSLINKIHRHFNPTITPPGKDITSLIQEVEFSVERSKLNDFWENLLSSGQFNFDLSQAKQELIRKSLEVNKDSVNDSLIMFIKQNKSYLRDFLSNHPDMVVRFNFSEEEVRTFWTTQLSFCNNILALYISFLRNGLIPKNELIEANRTVLNSIRDYAPTLLEHQILESNDFLNSIKDEIFDYYNITGRNSYLWINERADLISGIIKYYPADEYIIKRIMEHYSQINNSNWLLERFNIILTSNDPKTIEYKNMIPNIEIPLPAILNRYFL